MISLWTPLENFVGISPGAQKQEKGLLPCFSKEEEGGTREKRAKKKPFACRKFLKAVGIKCVQNTAFQVAVISYCLVYFENADSHESKPQLFAGACLLAKVPRRP